jgi:hypothetical protein
MLAIRGRTVSEAENMANIELTKNSSMGKGQQNRLQRSKVYNYFNIQKKTKRTEGRD